MLSCESLLAEIVHPSGRPVSDPANGDVIGRAPLHTLRDLGAALDRAEAAQPGWASLADSRRVAYLHRAADAIESSAEALAEILSREQGKPLNGLNARYEIVACVAWLRNAADTPVPSETLVDDDQKPAVLHYRALGVVGAITPWNWPMMIAVWQFAAALRMGNAVVMKPSEHTTLSGLALVAVVNRVLPAGVLSAVAGAGELGAALAGSPRVAKVMFTGSTKTGTRIISASAENVTRLTLELGGNDAGIVLPDADPVGIAEGLFWGAFINTGQTCAALKRLYVPEVIYGDVIDAIADYAGRVPMGVGLDEENLLGPLQNQMQYDVVARLVEEARASGARVVLGGDPSDERAGHFYPVTLVADIDPNHPLVVEEQFGPVLPIIPYSEVDDAIRMANGLDVGLGASVWSQDLILARNVAARLEAGTVWINAHGALDPRMPFGGAKRSGYGLEFGAEGLKAVAQPQVISG